MLYSVSWECRFMKPFAILLITIILAASVGIAPVHAACGTTYTVGRGETLYSIAEKCGLRYVVLININYEISDPNLIRPGQVIRLTAEEPLPEYTKPISGPDQPHGLQEDRIYIVRRGDSLARIAYLYSTTLWDLYQANPELGGKASVYTGQRIRIPQDARVKKGWVGVSSLGPATSSSIQARVVDFPPYAPVNFRLHELNEKEVLEGIKNAGPDLIRHDDNLSVFIETTTDARGSARVTIKLPTWARNTETWVVDVFTNNLGQEDVLARSPVMVIGRGY
jgi:LysM repeat protein